MSKIWNEILENKVTKKKILEAEIQKNWVQFELSLEIASEKSLIVLSMSQNPQKFWGIFIKVLSNSWQFEFDYLNRKFLINSKKILEKKQIQKISRIFLREFGFEFSKKKLPNNCHMFLPKLIPNVCV